MRYVTISKVKGPLSSTILQLQSSYNHMILFTADLYASWKHVSKYYFLFSFSHVTSYNYVFIPLHPLSIVIYITCILI